MSPCCLGKAAQPEGLSSFLFSFLGGSACLVRVSEGLSQACPPCSSRDQASRASRAITPGVRPHSPGRDGPYVHNQWWLWEDIAYPASEQQVCVPGCQAHHGRVGPGHPRVRYRVIKQSRGQVFHVCCDGQFPLRDIQSSLGQQAGCLPVLPMFRRVGEALPSPVCLALSAQHGSGWRL